ncbi:putative transcription factor & chromatin remodeling CW-Zn family [Dioscorea sansibarensis]
MLTVGRREDERKGIGLGFGGRMEENELEEGEACSGHEEETSSPEKDLTKLSYIDEKLHDVLGHFQKDFEGGVSAENLAMFGGYGSFLPTYQRSPSVWAHPTRSPANASSRNGSKSPCSTALMVGMRQNPAVLSVATINKTCAVEVSTAPSLDKSCKEDLRTNAAISADSIPQQDSVGKIINGSDQKTLKVRIKVGPESASARNKAAIYSGLGLDISPSSSPEDSPYVSEDHSADHRDAPDESPMTIIKIMTCFAVPGGFVLSPLHDGLLHLKEKEDSSLNNVWTNRPNVVTQVASAAFTDMPPSTKDGKNHLQKKMKSLEKNGRAIDVRSSSCKGDVSSILKRETDTEGLDGHDVHPDVSNFTSRSVSRDIEGKEGRQGFGESLKGSKIHDVSLDPNKLSGKGRLSTSDSVKDSQLYLIESFGNTLVGTSANEPTFSKGNLGSKTNLPEQVRGERGVSNLKDPSVDIQKEDRGKPEKYYDTARSDPDESMERKDLGVQYAEPANQNSAHRVNLYEQDEEMMFQVRKQASEGKGKWKKSQTNGAPSSQSMKKSSKTSSSMKIKEKKNRPPSKGECANDKLKELKFRDEYSMNPYKESHMELGDIKAELAEDRTKLVHAKDKMMGIKHENEYSLGSDERAKERPVVRMMDNPPVSEAVVTASLVAPMALNNQASDAVVAPASNAPVVIEENWVGCDKCQKWRLLPYGTNPGLLPKKWQCNMLNWLGPGMNKCSISEEETTKALHALYQIPVSQSNTSANGVNAVASNTVLAEGQFLNHTFGNNTTNLPAIGKKKHKLKDPSNLVNGPALLQGSASVKKNQQASVKSRSLNDVNVNRYQLESNMLSKADLDHSNNPTDFAVDRQKHKDEVKSQILGRHSDGGDFVGNAGRPSKLKTKREVDQDCFTTFKKLKKEELNNASEGWHSDYEGAGNLFSAKDNALPTDGSKHNMQNYNGFSSSKAEGILPTSSKRIKAQTQALSNCEAKDHVNGSNLERSKPGFISKKRKNKVSQETKGYPQSIHGDHHSMDSRVDAREAFSENELKREKKLKVLKPEVKDSSTRKADSRLENKGRLTKILFSGSRQHPTYGMENDGFAVKEEHREEFQVNAMPRQASEGMESFKKDSAYAQSSAAATSSSSKVSSSRKSRGNFQEARGSPVESVSSSPFRNSNSDKLLPSRKKFGRKDDALNAGLSAIGSPKIYSDGELDAGSERPERMKDNASFVQGRSLEGHRAVESRGLDSMRGKYDYKDNEANKLYEGKDKDGLHLTLFGDTHDDFSPTDFEGRNLVNATAKHDKYEPLDKDHFHDLDKMSNHHLANGSMQRKSCKGSSHSREKHNTKSGPDRSKIKVPGSVSKQVVLLSAKNDPDSQDMVHSASHDNYCKDSKHENGNCAYPEKDVEDVLKKESLVKLSFVGGRESHSDRGKQGNLEAHSSGMFDKLHRDGNSRDAVSGTGDGKSVLQDITQRDPHADDKKLIGRSEMAPGRGKSQPVVSHRDKQETQSRGNQSIPTVKGGKSEICPIDAANGDPKVIKSRKPDEEHQVSLRQATPSRPDYQSPVRRDGQSAANVLKEARDLKHKANRLKSEGLELESTDLYFQAAMKFLYYASLLEPPHVESARHGEGTQSVQMYSETARLCEFCAHEYERCKKMAAAALAYKCVEVAYMKVSYFKHSCASKDRHELQTALQMAVPGESPSSSASDVDNLNNQATLDKSTSARGVSSPQVAGSHVVAARNRPYFVRLLNYANETVCAFDASRKMQLAFVAAGSGLDKDSIGRLSSVKKVIDFNFHDVERLLQLIRFSMESISC